LNSGKKLKATRWKTYLLGPDGDVGVRDWSKILDEDKMLPKHTQVAVTLYAKEPELGGSSSSAMTDEEEQGRAPEEPKVPPKVGDEIVEGDEEKEEESAPEKKEESAPATEEATEGDEGLESRGEKRNRDPEEERGRVRIKTGTGAAASRKRVAEGDGLFMMKEMLREEPPTIFPIEPEDIPDYELAQIYFTHLEGVSHSRASL
jgi:hypothetical protein